MRLLSRRNTVPQALAKADSFLTAACVSTDVSAFADEFIHALQWGCDFYPPQYKKVMIYIAHRLHFPPSKHWNSYVIYLDSWLHKPGRQVIDIKELLHYY